MRRPGSATLSAAPYQRGAMTRTHRFAPAPSLRPRFKLNEARLDRVPDPPFERHVVEAIDFLNAGRRGDVDLRQIVADHVDPDEDEALIAQGGADGGTDFALAPRQLRLCRLTADMEIGARLALGRNAQ